MTVTSRPSARVERPPTESDPSDTVSELTYDQRANAATEAMRLVMATLESQNQS